MLTPSGIAGLARWRDDAVASRTPGEIDLWLSYYDEAADESLLEDYRNLLSAAERAQESRFYFARDRRRYLVTRALVRTVLSRYVAMPPREWVFSANAYGRPEVANPEGRGARLVFNISHTHSLIVLGVTRGRALGVDVENVNARRAPLDVADRYFAPTEAAALAAAPRPHQQYRFFEYWTFKEAYVKARGMGVSLPLDAFGFRYPNDRAVEFAIDPSLADDAARWQFWQFRPAPDYLVAVCAERVAGTAAPAITTRWSTPLVSDTPGHLEILRTSHGVSMRDRRREQGT